MQDLVDPVTDEMLARFVVDSHSKSQPKGARMEDELASLPQEDTSPADPEVSVNISEEVSLN